ncbi:Carbohydrate binding protein with CBM6 domain [Actinacidiphila cocklensis]|uniref:Carbohydrate binding protein with CBM6 domain n=2 Tax=Actinacidiphila cocklensis TaxID=887465 RepID=A0A9W4DLF3_9ACTN|nr:Carbohydrate binding protein with CBM6 domain [Actinacidiphila cocklensis]
MTDTSGRPSRRGVLGASLGGVLAATLPGAAAGDRAAASPPPSTAIAGPPATAALSLSTWQQRWSPSASTDGLAAFETVEDDRADSHPAGQPHIYPEGDNYRWNMHMVDRDTMTDRQRQEVTGMRSPAGGDYLQWLPGQTWRVTYLLYIPSSLKATSTFTHIMQMKEPGAGTSPIVVQSLRRVNGAQTIELQLATSGLLIGRTSLDPLHDDWTHVDFQIKVGDGTSGSLRWILRGSDGRQLIDVSKSGIDTYLADRVRPKYGIYRSLGDTSGSLEDCYLLITDMRGYQLVSAASADHQAEDARVSQGVFASDHTGYSGSGFVNYDNVTGGYVEWTFNSNAAATATLDLRYANGTAANRPMDIAVNGTVVSAGRAFDPTGSWDTWATSSLSVPLKSGTNTVRATATTSSGGPNVDKITVR